MCLRAYLFYFSTILSLIKDVTLPVNLLLISNFMDLLMASARVDHSTAIKPTGNKTKHAEMLFPH